MPVAVNCKECGQEFVRVKSGPVLYCSPQCKRTRQLRDKREHSRRSYQLVKPVAVEVTCNVCGETFTHQYARGRSNRKYCGPECQKKGAAINRALRIRNEIGTCSVDGCGEKAKLVGAGMCETHYYRMRRLGTTDLQPRIRKAASANGKYHAVTAKEHPLARKDGMLMEHRKVLYDRIGEAPHCCYWCGERLETWAEIVVDHLNENKLDNRESNLVASCNACNMARGALLVFFQRCQPERKPFALDLLVEWVQHHSGTENEVERYYYPIRESLYKKAKQPWAGKRERVAE